MWRARGRSFVTINRDKESDMSLRDHYVLTVLVPPIYDSYHGCYQDRQGGRSHLPSSCNRHLAISQIPSLPDPFRALIRKTSLQTLLIAPKTVSWSLSSIMYKTMEEYVFHPHSNPSLTSFSMGSLDRQKRAASY